MDVKGIG